MNSVFANRQTISKQILHQDVKVVMCEVFLPTNTSCNCVFVRGCCCLSGGGSLRQTQAADTSQAGM